MGHRILIGSLAIQALGAFTFLGELWTEVFGLRTSPIPWYMQEYIHLMASVCLIIGVAVSAIFVRRSFARMNEMGRQIEVASGNFETHLKALFAGWSLSPSEEAVAIYAMKGFSNTEIAEIRGTGVSTVKSQMNSIYRKTGLSNRQQLIALLVEDLLSGVAVERPAATGAAA